MAGRRRPAIAGACRPVWNPMLADAYTRYKADPANAGRAWKRLAGSGLYAGCQPLTVRVRMEGTEPHPQWYAHVCYAVPAAQARQPAADGALGLDRNVGQATDSEDTVYALPATNRLDARIACQPREPGRKQGWGPQDRRPKSNRGRRVNGQLRKLHRKGAQARQRHAPG